MRSLDTNVLLYGTNSDPTSGMTEASRALTRPDLDPDPDRGGRR